jgi:hypothetical protein
MRRSRSWLAMRLTVALSASPASLPPAAFPASTPPLFLPCSTSPNPAAPSSSAALPAPSPSKALFPRPPSPDRSPPTLCPSALLHSSSSRTLRPAKPFVLSSSAIKLVASALFLLTSPQTPRPLSPPLLLRLRTLAASASTLTALRVPPLSTHLPLCSVLAPRPTAHAASPLPKRLDLCSASHSYLRSYHLRTVAHYHKSPPL